MGAGKQVKAGLTGDKAGTPPRGHHSGKVGRRQSGHAPPPGTADARRAGNAEASRPAGAHTPHTAELTPYFYRKTIAIGKNMW